MKGKEPSVNEVLTNLFLAERGVDPHRPDYFYANRRDKAYGNNPTMREIIDKSLDGIVSRCLELRGNRVVVKCDLLERWQEVVTFFPPLPLVSHAIYHEHGAPPYVRNYIDNYIREKIDPNAGRTAIPSPFIPQLMRLVEEEGLYETHVHLNGTTEADHVWLHALENPEDFFAEFRKSYETPLVREQFAQIEPGLTPKKVYDRLRLAGRLREELTLWLYKGRAFIIAHLRRISNLEALPFSRNDDTTIRKRHPLIDVFPWYAKKASLPLEALFQIHCFRYLDLNAPAAFVHGYHLYLLLLGFFNKLIVQQVSQVGFDQFQKITLNEARSSSEKSYQRRLEQLSGNTGDHLAFVEGRFSPKLTIHQNIVLLGRIMEGYGKYQGLSNVGIFQEKDITLKQRPQLRLVAHFIKEKDAKPKNDGIPQIKVRHHELRVKLERQGKALLVTTSESQLLRKFIVGIDAAANELHAGPEVFAPLYRLFRRNGFVNFTFHVGEDFHHLVSGMRAIYEALFFLDLRSGNRIGHGTAVGIDPSRWLRVMDDGIVLTRGEWLTDLIFAYDQFTEYGLGSSVIEKLKKRIKELAEEVYGYVPPVATLIAAWKMRGVDPLACYPERRSTDQLDLGDRTEWELVRGAMQNQAAFGLFLQYHLGMRKWKLDELIEADLSLFSSDNLLDLQRSVLLEIHRRQIAIESMLTSNVRISLYDSHSDHHLWRWIDDNQDETHPIICLGTDDPGIFATNLCNEFSHVYDQLTRVAGKSTTEAISKMRILHSNAKSHVFR